MLFRSDVKNPRAKKANSQKPKQKKQHLCHHCGASGHTRLNCYQWLATQLRNSMISFGNQNQFPSSFAPLGDLLMALMFLSNLNSFNSSPYHRIKGSLNGKVLPRCGRKKVQSNLVTFFLSLSFLLMHYLCVLLSCF